MDVIKLILPYLMPALLGIGAGLGASIFGKKKDRVSLDESLKNLVVEIVEKRCSECGFFKTAKSAEKTERQINQALSVLSDFESEIKKDYLHFLTEFKFCEKSKLLDYKPFIYLQSALHSGVEKIIDEIRDQFHRDKLSQLNSLEIENRSKRLYNILNEILDKYYKAENPNRIELFDYMEIKKPSYINVLQRIYEQAKDIKDEI